MKPTMTLPEATERIEAAGWVLDGEPYQEAQDLHEVIINRLPQGPEAPVFDEIRIGRPSEDECLSAAVKIAEVLKGE